MISEEHNRIFKIRVWIISTILMARKYIDNGFYHNTPLSALKFAKDKRKLRITISCKLSYSAILWHSPQSTPKIQLTIALLRETSKESETLKWSQTTQLNPWILVFLYLKTKGLEYYSIYSIYYIIVKNQ